MTLTVIAICSLLTFTYMVLMLIYRLGWIRVREFRLPPVFRPSVFISVVVPARNEHSNIAACINALLAQQYPEELYEVIVVDDHSEDDTAAIAGGYAGQNVSCIRLAEHMEAGGKTNAYKKAALAAGIAAAKGALIVTTDADCMAPAEWLSFIAARYEQDKPAMIVAPVVYTTGRSISDVFQLTDFMSMQGITAAAHSMGLGNMSNGANLAFRKDAYEDVAGYDGIDHLASGDDYLLMMKLNRRFPGRMAYLKSAGAIVTTAPQPGWRSFLQQRIRWASKSGKYNDPRLTVVLLLVYLFNLSFVVLCVAGIFHPAYLYAAAVLLAIKIVAELFFLWPVAGFFKKRRVLWYFPFLQPLHILYIVIAGFLGFKGGYTWKGRWVK